MPENAKIPWQCPINAGSVWLNARVDNQIAFGVAKKLSGMDLSGFGRTMAFWFLGRTDVGWQGCEICFF